MRTIPPKKKSQPTLRSKNVVNSPGKNAPSLIAFNPMQAHIISAVSKGQILIANAAACRLLGYTKKELLTKSRSAIFGINEAGFKKMLGQTTAASRSAAFAKALKKNGKLLPVEITSAVFIDEDGIKKSITIITDISQRILQQKNIDDEKEKIVADNIAVAKAKQKGIDIKNKKIVDDNITKAISRQKRIDVKNEKIVAKDIAVAKAKQKGIDVKKEKIVADNIIVARTRQKKIDVKKEKIVAENITLAEEKCNEEKLGYEIAIRKNLMKEFSENFKLTFNSSSDVLYDCDLLTNEVIINDAYEKDFGYRIVEHMSPDTAWASHIHEDDKETVYKEYARVLASEETEWISNYRFLRLDDSVADVTSRILILRDTEGKAYRFLGYMKDQSKQKVLEDRLENEIKLKERQIEDASKEAKDTVRSDIGKELHDNINQLLGASKMYLEMAKQGGSLSEFYLGRSSEYTLNAIEEIRKLTKGLTTDLIRDLGLWEAIGNISRDSMELSHVKIAYGVYGFVESSVNDKFKLNLYRIVQEHLNNILKHAQATKVVIRLSQNSKCIMLSLTDNGIGFDTKMMQKGIGVANIKSRAASYKGTADFVSQTGKGCVLTVNFPFSKSLGMLA
jgi:PAS domain S-box-containing protein